MLRTYTTEKSSAGWILYDKTTNFRLAGSFHEESPGAGSYRGEVLGLCALQLLLLGLEEWYQLGSSPPLSIYCDNEKAGERAQAENRRVKPGWSSADVLRSFRNTRQLLSTPVTFHHVSAHMDDLIPWTNLSLPEQLNCMCDALAKDALLQGLRSKHKNRRNILPREHSAVFFHAGKSTSDPASHIRLDLGRERAKLFLVQEKSWSPEQFEAVAWTSLHETLLTKPLAFRLWLSKQHSNFCATGVQMKRCKSSDDDRCPSCWRRKERASHLCICPSEARTSLFNASVRELEQWLGTNNNTADELAYWIPKYIRARGALKFCELGAMSPAMRTIAESQDLIGWRNFMEGRISKFILPVQEAHLHASSSRLTSRMWMRALISKLLHISHAQWLLRNFMLHDSQSGYLKLKNRLELLTQIESLSNIPAHEIPDESRFLLDIDTNSLAEGDLESQEYWVQAMEAARAALGRQPANLPFTNPLRPSLAREGSYTLLEEIRQEKRFSKGMTAPGQSASFVSPGPGISESHRAARLSSNRQRQPD